MSNILPDVSDGFVAFGVDANGNLAPLTTTAIAGASSSAASKSGSLWLTSTTVSSAPSTGGWSTAIADASSALSAAAINMAYTCCHFSCISAPVQITVEWMLQGASQGMEIVPAGATIHRDVTFDSIKITTLTGVSAGQTIQIFGRQ